MQDNEVPSQADAPRASTAAGIGSTPPPSNRDKAIAFLEHPGRAVQLARHLGITRANAVKMLWDLTVDGRMRRLDNDLYCAAPSSPQVPAAVERRTRLLAVMDRPRTVADAAAAAGLRTGAYSTMVALVRDGRVEDLGGGFYGKPAGRLAQPVASPGPSLPDLLHALRTPQSARTLAAAFKVPAEVITTALHRCEADGRVVGAGYGCYIAAGPQQQPRAARARPQPVRDAILAYLTEPRQAHEIAAHTCSAPSVTTGHLRAMLARNLVVRTGFGRYERADLVGASAAAATIKRPATAQDIVLGCLDQPARRADLRRKCNLRAKTISGALAALVSSGKAVRLAPDCYAKAGTPWDSTLPPPAARPRPAQQAVLACLDQPQHRTAIAARCGCTVVAARDVLQTLAKQGQVVRIAPGCFARPETLPDDALQLLAEQRASLESRQPAQAAVLALLAEPKTLTSLAAATGRTIHVVNKALLRLRAAGKVSRVARGVYLRADLVQTLAGTPPQFQPSPSQDAVLACLDRPRHLSEIAARTGLTAHAAREALRKLARKGKVQVLGNRLFGPAA